jgi:Amt family ammonium transporter
MSGFICWYASTAIKQKLGYDDSLDVFGVHGVGGFIGTIMLAVFMADNLGGVGYGEGNSMGSQLGTQVYAALFTAVYTAIATWIILKIVSMLTGGIRVDEGEETTGLDQSYHGEEAYND